jgi:hypothetical protein
MFTGLEELVLEVITSEKVPLSGSEPVKFVAKFSIEFVPVSISSFSSKSMAFPVPSGYAPGRARKVMVHEYSW